MYYLMFEQIDLITNAIVWKNIAYGCQLVGDVCGQHDFVVTNMVHKSYMIHENFYQASYSC